MQIRGVIHRPLRHILLIYIYVFDLLEWCSYSLLVGGFARLIKLEVLMFLFDAGCSLLV